MQQSVTQRVSGVLWKIDGAANPIGAHGLTAMHTTMVVALFTRAHKNTPDACFYPHPHILMTSFGLVLRGTEREHPYSYHVRSIFNGAERCILIKVNKHEAVIKNDSSGVSLSLSAFILSHEKVALAECAKCPE